MRAVVVIFFLLTACSGGASSDLDKPFASWEDLKFANVTRQRTDFTCGAASLSIISEHYWGRPIQEIDFTAAIRATYTKDEWLDKEKNGLSLLDMKHAAEHFGFHAEGLKLTLADLINLKGPVIVHLDKGFIEHFAVYKGIIGDRVYLADPFVGNSRVPLYRFLEWWSGYVLAIWIDDQPLPAVNGLAVDPHDLPNQLRVGAREALYLNQPIFGAILSPY
jgi:uncharacterized protein